MLVLIVCIFNIIFKTMIIRKEIPDKNKIKYISSFQNHFQKTFLNL